MWCSILIAMGVACTQPEPPRDRAAEVLVEQEKRAEEREAAEVARALAARDRLYRGLGDKCRDCGTVNVLPGGKMP